MAWKVRKIVSYLAIGTMLLAALFAMVGNVRADTEPNDSFAQAEQLTLSGGTVTVTGTLETNNDDYYKFSANAGEYITVTLSFNAANDFDLSLYDPSQSEIDYAWTSGVPEVCEAEAETTGTYYVGVFQWSGSGSYTLTVTLGAPPAGDGNNDFANATEITATAGGPIISQVHNLSSSDEVDYFKVKLNAGYGPGGVRADKLHVVVNTSQSVTLVGTIYDPFEYDVYFNYTQSASVSIQMHTVAYYTDYYYIELWNYYGSSFFEYTIKVWIETYQPWTNDSNNAPIHAANLNFVNNVATVSQTIDNETDPHDFFNLPLTVNPGAGTIDAVDINVVPPTGCDLYVAIYNDTDVLLDYNHAVGPLPVTLHFAATENLTYKLRLLASNGGSLVNPYTMTVTKQLEINDNDFENATLVTEGTYTENVNADGDTTDFYKVNLNPGEGVYARVTHNVPTGDLDLYGFNSTEYCVDFSWYNDQPEMTGNTVQQEFITIAANVSGFYYIVVDAYEGDIDYTLTITKFTWTNDNNNEFATAVSVSNNSVVNGALYGPGTDSQDVYKINVGAGETLTVNLTTENIDEGTYLRIYTPTYTQAVYDYKYSTSSYEAGYYLEVETTATAAGDYYVIVQVFNVTYPSVRSSSGNYTVKFVKMMEPLTDDSPAGANVILPGQTATGTVNSSDDKDYYKIYLNAGQAAEAHSTANKTGDVTDLWAYDTTGTGRLDRDYNTDYYGSQTSNVVFAASEAGYYYVCVDNFGSGEKSYSLIVNVFNYVDTAGSTPATAQAVGSGQTVTGTLACNVDKTDYYVFTTDSPGLINISFYKLAWGGDDASRIQLEYPNGTVITYVSSHSSYHYYNISYDAPEAGTYYLNATIDDLFTGNYTITFDFPGAGPVNQPPVIISTNPPGTTFTMQVSTTQTFSVVASDPNGDTLMYTWTVDGSAVGSNSPSYDYTAPSEPGTHTIEVTVSDGSLTATHSWLVTVVTAPTNHAPVFETYSPAYTVFPLQVNTPWDFYANATDEDGDPIIYTWTLDGAPESTSTNHYQYPGSANAGETHILTVTASDGSLSVSHTWTIKIQTTVSQAPVITGSTPAGSTVTIPAQTDQTFSVTATDPDGDTLTYTWYVDDVEISGQTGTSYTTQWPAEGVHTVRVDISDGSWTVSREWTVTVTAPNLAPTITASSPSDPVSIEGGNSQTFSVTATDPDGDTLTYTWYVDGSQVGTNSNSYTYTAPGTAGTHTVKVVVSDVYHNVEKTWSVTVTVTPSNHAPTINTSISQTATTPEDTPLSTLDLDNVFIDEDGDALTYTFTPNGNFTITINPTTHVVTITPKANWAGTSTIIFTASDSEFSVDWAFTVTVQARNDAPTLNGTIPAITLNEDSTTTLDLKPYFVDVEGDTLTFTITWAHGTVTILSGVATFQPNANWEGTDTITINCSDGKGGFVETTVSISVTGVNDAPTGTITITPVKTKYKDTDKITFTVTASDVDDTTLSYEWKDGTKPISGVSNVSTFTKKFSAGTHTISVTISDGKTTTTVTANAIKVEKSQQSSPGFEMVAAFLAIALLVGAFVVLRRRF